MKGVKTAIVCLMATVFLGGLLFALYPCIHGAIVDTQMEQQAHQFIVQAAITPSKNPTESCEPAAEPEQVPYADLLQAMQEYNNQIWEEKQEGLCSSRAYQHPSFTLGDYGLNGEVFGVITVPSLDVNLPIYLGATYQHMADGAAHLSQTSLLRYV